MNFCQVQTITVTQLRAAAEIRSACLRIQATWDDDEFERRTVYQQEPVTAYRWDGV